MLVRKLTYYNFRNLPSLEWEPGPGFNILWGNNAQGKTNLLEGIYLLANLKSFRAGRNEELIRHGEEQSRISALLEGAGVAHKLELILAQSGRSYLFDSKPLAGLEQLAETLRAILFTPEEIGVLRSSPQARRALLDRALFQCQPSHLGRVRKYDKILRQRNTLLRQGAPLPQLQPWTEALIEAGAALRRQRGQFLVEFMPWFVNASQAIGGNDETVSLNYPDGIAEEAELRLRLARDLEQTAGRERAQGQTQTGPHRDDLHFVVGGKPLRQFGSQGQLRSALLAFKVAQLALLEEQVGHPPVLLLDDMTSELDRERQERLFNYLQRSKGQVFITTTAPAALLADSLRGAVSHRVAQGMIFSDQGP
jgi:DNA replication and repair protein RecF